jgi:acetyl esterase/lipase
LGVGGPAVVSRPRTRAAAMIRSERARTPTAPVVASALEVANTLNAWRPFSRSAVPAAFAFVCGWPTSELPLHALGLSALRLASAARRGDIQGSAGRAALGLACLSWLGLAGVYQRQLRSKTVLDKAVRDAVGERPDITWTPSGVRLTTSRPLVRRRRRYVSPEATFAYGDAGRFNKLDVWRHLDLPDDARAPVVLQVPGGGWVTGGRRGQAYPLLTRLSAAGWVCVSMSYRLSPRHPWPAHILDVKRALAWVKANIAEHGGDPDFVAITGGSAGGHLAALAALTPDDKSLQPGFEDVDLSVAAAVPLYGRYDWLTSEGPGRRELVVLIERYIVQRRIGEALEVFRAASPLLRVGPDAPPFFVLHGEYDSVIPVEEARAFVDALRAVSRAPVAYAELPGAQHGFDFFESARARNSAQAVHDFLDTVYAANRPPKRV